MATTSETQTREVTTENEPQNVIPGFSTVSEFSKDSLKAVLLATKLSNELPTAESDYEYYQSFPGFRQAMYAESTQILDMMSTILKHQGIKGNIRNLGLEESSEFLADANDIIMERIGSSIDEASGITQKKDDHLLLARISARDAIRNMKLGVGSWNKKKLDNPNSPKYSLLAARNIERPQIKFHFKIDNGSEPFVPIIKEKPNSLKQLAIILEPTEKGIMYSHPYQVELEHFKPLPEHLEPSEIQTPSSLDDTPMIWIDNVSQIDELMDDLRKCSEIAVDLEHHSYRTFQGFACLMQISTKDKDYLIDTLQLRNDLQVLNEVFTDPKIVKIFHGADKDVEWLQRDLGLYIVNMFDTGQAARVLNFPSFSLAYLLKLYFQVEADKQYQLADWRIRPLPNEMTRYAREDTHYLIHIYNRMKNELLEKGNEQKNLLESVFQRSKIICEKRYVKPVFHEDNYQDLYKKSKKMFNSRQLYALKELYSWRDRIARIEDESTGYILPNHMLLQIAEILPREQQGILACCNPIPPIVRQQLNELHQVILKARDQSLIKPIAKEFHMERSRKELQFDIEDPLYCPHDLSHLSDRGENLSMADIGTNIPLTAEKSSLMESQATTDKEVHSLVKTKPIVTVFQDSEEKHKESHKYKDAKAALALVKSPYSRYLFMLSIKDEITMRDEAEPKEDHKERVFDHLRQLMSEEQQVECQNESQETEDRSILGDIKEELPADVEQVNEEEPLRNQIPEARKKKKKWQRYQQMRKRKIQQLQHINSHNPCAQNEYSQDPSGNEGPSLKKFKPARKKKNVNKTEPFDYSQVDYNRFKSGPKAKGYFKRKKKLNQPQKQKQMALQGETTNNNVNKSKPKKVQGQGQKKRNFQNKNNKFAQNKRKANTEVSQGKRANKRKVLRTN